jgi:hypothetical protein
VRPGVAPRSQLDTPQRSYHGCSPGDKARPDVPKAPASTCKPEFTVCKSVLRFPRYYRAPYRSLHFLENLDRTLHREWEAYPIPCKSKDSTRPRARKSPLEDNNRFHQNQNYRQNDRERDRERAREPERRPDPRVDRERSRSRAWPTPQENLPEKKTISGGYRGG